MKKIMTLCVVHIHPHVLLGMKKRGFGMGRWNGFGGKVCVGEDIKEAAERELFEEASIHARDLERVGVVNFQEENKPDILEVHIFRVSDFTGEPKEGEEMRPEWFSVDTIPFHKMWPDDAHWFPLFLAGKKFRGDFLFDEKNAILKHSLFEVEYI